MKKKKKIAFTIDSKLLIELDKITTSRSRLIETILLDYLCKNGIKINDIIL
jgi:metal-responsive CopG/Arc/MetJ family transcriptional regulator